MQKEEILNLIRSHAEANGGVVLGQEKFEAESGLRRTEWFGKYWARWSDAVQEAGLTPNSLNSAYDEQFLLKNLADLTKRLGRYPPSGDLRLESKRNSSFPSHNVFSRLGRKAEKLKKLRDFCTAHPDFISILPLIEVPVEADQPVAETIPTENDGFVYIMRFGHHYKIGRTNEIGRRSREVALELPEKIILVHAIRTDDPPGIEAYWHRRFQSKRRNGEWFELTPADLRAFKKRKFM